MSIEPRAPRTPPACHRWPMLLLRATRHRFDCRLKTCRSTSINQTRPMGGHRCSLRRSCAGHESCVEMLLAAPGMDVNDVVQDGAGVLGFAITHVMTSLRQVGSGDITRILVLLMASRQVSSQALSCAISYLQMHWLTNTQVAGGGLTDAHEVTRLLLPVLRAQSTGERRWCGWCWALTPIATCRCARGAGSTGTAAMRKGSRTWSARRWTRRLEGTGPSVLCWRLQLQLQRSGTQRRAVVQVWWRAR